jgi:hypothetical protein
VLTALLTAEVLTVEVVWLEWHMLAARLELVGSVVEYIVFGRWMLGGSCGGRWLDWEWL